MKLLLTGFEPFGGDDVNPSGMVAQQLPAPEGVEIVRAVLPVSFHKVGTEIVRLIDEHLPDVVLMMGMAASRPEISLERIGVNLWDARMPDNDNYSPTEVTPHPEAPDAYLTSLPLRRLVECVRAAGVPAGISNSAGLYVCNSLLFEALHHVHRRGLPARVGFVHLPSLPSQVAQKGNGKPSMSFADMLTGVSAIVRSLYQSFIIPYNATC